MLSDLVVLQPFLLALLAQFSKAGVRGYIITEDIIAILIAPVHGLVQ